MLVALVQGEGAHFSAGADISEFDEVYRDAAATRDYGDTVQDGLRALMDLDRPTIAVIRGVAVGGGLGLALACDLRFRAADGTLRSLPPGSASSTAMPRPAGWSSWSARRGPRIPVHRAADRNRGGAGDRAHPPEDRDRA